METKFYKNDREKLMYRRSSPTEMIVVQILGRDLGGTFSHRHARLTYPSAELAQEAINGLREATPDEWEKFMCEYLAVNKMKLEIMSDHRQRAYESGRLHL
jgi:hypothetical protein